MLKFCQSKSHISIKFNASHLHKISNKMKKLRSLAACYESYLFVNIKHQIIW